MAIPPLEPHIEGQTDLHPLLMERPENRDPDHIIDIQRSCTSSWSNSSPDDPSPSLNHQQNEERPSSSTRAPVSQPSLDSSDSPNSRNSSFTRRNDGYGRRRRSPLNSGMWISIELLVTLSQIVAAIVVLSLSRHENPQAPLFAWIVGYASGCVATLPLLYWRFLHRNQGTEEDSTNQRQGSSHSNPLSAPSPFATISVLRASDEEDHQPSVTAARNGQGRRTLSARVSVMVDHFKMALDCFFAVWFVVGNVWIFGGHSSSSEAPNLYRLCIVFLTFSCIGYAMPFILCATICCCLPCIISILGFREDLNHNRGATAETINVLPTYKFKLKKNSNGVAQETNSEGVGEGGVLAAGTEKERVISGEDAVCCICLAKYADNEDLRELPCTHFFHVECVDKWLKINALCPLCKSEIVESSENLQSTAANSSQLHSERRVGNGSTDGDAYGTTVF